MRRYGLIGLLACCALSYGLSLEEAYRLACQHDPVYRQIAWQWRASQQAPRLARALWRPSLSVTGHFEPRHLQSGTTTTRGNQYGYTASLSQRLFDIPQWLERSHASEESKQAYAQFRDAQQQLIQRVVKTYVDTLLAQDGLKVQQRYIHQVKAVFSSVKARYQQGLATTSQLYQAQADYDQARAARWQYRQNLVKAQGALHVLVGKKVTHLHALKPLKTHAPEPKTSKAWVHYAWAHHPALLAKKYALSAWHIAEKQVKTQRLPRVTLQGSITDQNQVMPQGAGIQGQFLNKQLSVQAAWQPYEGGHIAALRARTHAHYRAALVAMHGLKRQIASDVHTHFLGVYSAQQRVIAMTQALRSARSAVAAYQARYKQGTVLLSDYLASLSTAAKVQYAWQQAQYDYIMEVVALDASAGQLSKSRIQAISQQLGSSVLLGDEPMK